MLSTVNTNRLASRRGSTMLTRTVDLADLSVPTWENLSFHASNVLECENYAHRHHSQMLVELIILPFWFSCLRICQSQTSVIVLIMSRHWSRQAHNNPSIHSDSLVTCCTTSKESPQSSTSHAHLWIAIWPSWIRKLHIWLKCWYKYILIGLMSQTTIWWEIMIMPTPWPYLQAN
jgi:hypothetical protein